MVSIGTTVQDNDPTLSKENTYSGILFGIFIVIIFLLFAYYFLTSSGAHLTSTTATITKVVSVSYGARSAKYTSVDISYTIDNVQYSNHVLLSGTYYTGQAISIRYDPANPKNIDVGIAPQYFGAGFCVVAMGLSMCIMQRLFLAVKYKVYSPVRQRYQINIG